MTAPLHQDAGLTSGPEQELRREPVDRMTSVGYELVVALHRWLASALATGGCGATGLAVLLRRFLYGSSRFLLRFVCFCFVCRRFEEWLAWLWGFSCFCSMAAMD